MPHNQERFQIDDAVHRLSHEFLRIARIDIVSIGAEEASLALAAFARYGKGRGHPAQLNPGACFAYAVAKHHGTRLLFARDDFSLTDTNRDA
jgi:ribonuclease VapC